MAYNIGGFVAPGYERVAEAFEQNFAERGELGAAFAAYRCGVPIVDLWGGVADRASGRRWTEDTLQLVFSGTKGLVAVCVAILIDRGLLELDAPVTRYWPEFAAHGKEQILVRDVVSHSTPLPGIDVPLGFDDLADDRRMAALIAVQAPSSDARATRCYHARTFGWLCGELVRRIDGRSIGCFFRDEVAVPLALEIWIGLPAELEPRVAMLELADTWGASSKLNPDMIAADVLARSIWANPICYTREAFPWNSPRLHEPEVPSTNGIGTARSMARLYASLDTLLSEETLELVRRPLTRRHEPLLDQPQAFGVGFALQTELRALGPPKDAFGHGGAGGSIHGAWPSARLGFSYAMNLMRDDEPVNPRAQTLLCAMHGVLAHASPAGAGAGFSSMA